MNDTKQIELLEQFIVYYDESLFPDQKTQKYRYYYLNPAYSYGDALILYSMMRHFKPNNIIEVGSGYSSGVMMDTNDLFFCGDIDIRFIEPYPELLFSLMHKDDKNNYQVIPTRLQDILIDSFQQLKQDDILFIDSTHVSKLSSDVNKVFFEILPSLQKGVIIHMHDIFWDFEYPDDWVQEGRCWNESYILRAFLEFNDTFEIMLFSSYLDKKYPDLFKKNMPLSLKNTGASIWFRKIR